MPIWVTKNVPLYVWKTTGMTVSHKIRRVRKMILSLLCYYEKLQRCNSVRIVHYDCFELLEMQKEEEEIIPCLQHQDIITQILNRVPAESLYATLMYVCKPWLRIITSPVFQHNHPLSNDPPCLIIQNLNYTSYTFKKSPPEDQANMLIERAKRLGYVHTPRYYKVGLEGNNVQLHMTPAFLTLRRVDPHTTCSIQVGEEGILRQVDLTADFNMLHIRACCNGLMIVHPYGYPSDTLYLVNIITKQSVKLPTPTYTVNIRLSNYPVVGFVLVPSTGEYKVVLLRDPAQEGASKKRKMTRSFDIQILTFRLGDSGGSSSYGDLHWRVVQAPLRDRSEVPIAVDGVLYWSRPCNTRIITCFEAREERFYTVSCPGDDPSVLLKEGILEMAGYIASWIYSSDHQQLDFWILKNFRTGGEWMKYSSVRIGDQSIASRIDETYVQPILSYGSNGEVIIFLDRPEGNLLAYNMGSSIWWRMGNNNVKLVGDKLCFHGFHVNKILPLDSLLKKKQPV